MERLLFGILKRKNPFVVVQLNIKVLVLPIVWLHHEKMNINSSALESKTKELNRFHHRISCALRSSGTLRFWQLDVPNRKIRPTDINTGVVKRIVKNMAVC